MGGKNRFALPALGSVENVNQPVKSRKLMWRSPLIQRYSWCGDNLPPRRAPVEKSPFLRGRRRVGKGLDFQHTDGKS